MKRYDLVCGFSAPSMCEQAEGEFVRFEDHCEEVERIVLSIAKRAQKDLLKVTRDKAKR